MFTLVIGLIFLIIAVFKYWNRNYFVLAGCKRIRTVDGSKLETKIKVIRGKTIFGNNLDLIGAKPEDAYQYVRKNHKISNGNSHILYGLLSPMYSITRAEDAEVVFQSQSLITKGFMYDFVKPFLGLGLLISTDELWHSRRKLVTPAFHFNILQTFMEVFKKESNKVIEVLNGKLNAAIAIHDFIPQFTLNNISSSESSCALYAIFDYFELMTALGVKLDDMPEGVQYCDAVNALPPYIVNRLFNPLLFFDVIYKLTPYYWQERKIVHIMHNFSSKIIEKKRKELQKRKLNTAAEKANEYDKKQRYAMMDTLLDAENQGLIDHQGICDEVNTIIFGGHDTLAVFFTFVLLNLAIHQDIQQKCYEEIEYLAPLEELTVFDFNKLEYLECVIKETLRLYPSVPFLARSTTKEMVVNGLVLPPNTSILIHTFDIMRDERHFPEPNKFDPERFRPQNTTNRHPFAFVPFSAGPRNCIGQKFAMLQAKVFLVAVLRKFILKPVTSLDEITLAGGIVMGIKEKVQIKVTPRE